MLRSKTLFVAAGDVIANIYIYMCFWKIKN